MSIRKMVKQRRMKLDLSLREVGERSGLSISHISEIERGKSSPSIHNYIKLCRALNVRDMGYYLKDELEEE